MTNKDEGQHRSILQRIARKAMVEKGLIPDFSIQAIAELSRINGAVTKIEGATKDLRNLLWCSIDNDDSLDLDQLTVAIQKPGNSVNILIAIDRKSTRLNSSHLGISYAVFCLKKKKIRRAQ